MNVEIKGFGLDLEVKNKGLEIAVRDTRSRQLGDLYLTKTGLVWCKGRTSRGRGKKMTWTEFIELAERLN